MANQLKMGLVHTVLSLHKLEWSDRRIARELGIHRETVGRHIHLAEAASKPATEAPLGSDEAREAPTGSVGEAKPANQAPLGSPGADLPPAGGEHLPEVPPGAASQRPPLDAEAVPAARPPHQACQVEGGSQGRSQGGQVSQCEPFRSIIQAKLEQGLTAQRIYQDLVVENGFDGSYYSVRRFVGNLGEATHLPLRRMECPPGEESQVDFGAGAPIVSPDGRRQKSHVFRTVLGCSRKGYSEGTFRQTTDAFLQCLENSFWDWGGVPRIITIDNLRAAVKHPDWYDPELNPKVLSFCQHYGTVILPTKPYTPRHKGKVERGIAYVQGNALKGRTFTSLQEENRHLQQWEATVADTRIHGTTRRQVGKVFQEVEKPALLPLPAGRFPFFHEAQRSVHRDGHVEVEKAYYSVPPEYLGRRVWVRWDGRVVRIFSTCMVQIAVHVQHEAGRFSTQNQHIDPKKVSGVEKGTTWLLQRASLIGPQTDRWAQAMLQARGVEGIRVLVGLNSLGHRHRPQAIEDACEKALSHGAFRLRVIRELIKRGGGTQEAFEFLQEHEIIRDMSEYGQLVRASLCGEPAMAETL
jgi:transposase